MSQRTTGNSSGNNASSSPLESIANATPNGNANANANANVNVATIASISICDSDDDDSDNFVGFPGFDELQYNPVTESDFEIDLCLSPSTSAAAAARTSTLLERQGASGGDEPTENGLDCPICLQPCIHPARLPCGHIFCFLCVKGVAYKNLRCAMCRRDIPAEFLENPQLVNGIEDVRLTRATEDGYQWYYEGRNGWWQYDDRTSQDIEEAFKKGDKSCTILVAGYVYVVDLEALIQQRQNEPTRCRRVKRDLATIPKKGVAGLRIEGNTVTSDTHFTQQTSPTSNNTPANTAANLISTIAATDAAIRMASDIIGSTLAHADELTRNLTASNISDSAGDLSGEHANNSFNSHLAGPASSPIISNQQHSQGTGARSLASSLHSSNSIQDLMRSATEDLLDTTHVMEAIDSNTIDLFEQALNDFQTLTLHNFVDSSDEDNESHHEDNISAAVTRTNDKDQQQQQQSQPPQQQQQEQAEPCEPPPAGNSEVNSRSEPL